MNLELSYLPATYDAQRWGIEMRPIVAWHDEDWLFAFNPILDWPLGSEARRRGPSFEPAVKASRTVGPVALGFEYYATLGPLTAILPWQDEQQQLFEVVDLVSVDRLELNFGVGEGLTPRAPGIVIKAIVGYEFGEARLRERQLSARGALAAPPRPR